MRRVFEIRGSANPAEPWQKAAEIQPTAPEGRLKVELVRSDSSGVLTSPMDARLLIVSEQGQVLEQKTFVIVPRLKTEWRLEVRHKGSLLELLELGRDRFQLNVPPSVEQAPLNLQLVRVRGTASKVRVELFPVDAEGLALAESAVWTQELMLEPGKDTITIPMLPPAVVQPLVPDRLPPPRSLLHRPLRHRRCRRICRMDLRFG